MSEQMNELQTDVKPTEVVAETNQEAVTPVDQETAVVSSEAEKPKSEEIPAELQPKVGKLLKAERERARRQVEQEYQTRLTMMQQPQAPQQDMANQVFDPETGEMVDAQSPIGQILVRNYKVAQRREQARLVNENQSLREKVEDGFVRYDDYDAARQTFVNFGTDFMAETLKGTEDPAAIVHYLGTHQEELKRVAQLPPAKQQRAIFELDYKFNPPKKLVSKAAKPVNTINENANPATSYQNLSHKAKTDIWAEKINKRR